MSGSRGVAQLASWPLRRFFLPQFAWVRAQVKQTGDELSQRMSEIERRVESVGSDVEEAVTDASLATSEGLGLIAMEVRRLVDRVGELEAAGEDSVGLAFIFRELGTMSSVGTIAHVGGPTGLGCALAALGYKAFDAEGPEPAGAPADVLVWVASDPIETGDDSTGRQVLERLRTLAAPGARLVLVALIDFGSDGDAHTHEHRIERLLSGWDDVRSEVLDARSTGSRPSAGSVRVPTARSVAVGATASAPD